MGFKAVFINIVISYQESGISYHLLAQLLFMWYNINAKRERRVSAMKKFIQKYGSFLAMLAILVTTMNENAACVFIMHQDSLPEEAKKLRKF